MTYNHEKALEAAIERFGGERKARRDDTGREQAIYIPSEEFVAGPLDYYMLNAYTIHQTPHLVEGALFRDIWNRVFDSYGASDQTSVPTICERKELDMRLYSSRIQPHYFQVIHDEDYIATVSISNGRYRHDISQYNILLCDWCERKYQNKFDKCDTQDAVERLSEVDTGELGSV